MKLLPSIACLCAASALCIAIASSQDRPADAAATAAAQSTSLPAALATYKSDRNVDPLRRHFTGQHNREAIDLLATALQSTEDTAGQRDLSELILFATSCGWPISGTADERLRERMPKLEMESQAAILTSLLLCGRSYESDWPPVRKHFGLKEDVDREKIAETYMMRFRYTYFYNNPNRNYPAGLLDKALLSTLEDLKNGLPPRGKVVLPEPQIIRGKE